MAASGLAGVTVGALELRVGDRLDIGGKSRIAVLHGRGDQVLARVETRGARSATVKSWAASATVRVYRPAAGAWLATTDREGRRHYVRADGHVIDGHGVGRMRWTVRYPDGDYGMTDSLAEAKAWADA